MNLSDDSDPVDIEELELWTSAVERHIQQKEEQPEPSAQDDEVTRMWRESQFAVGKTKPTWADDDHGCTGFLSACCSGHKFCHLYLTGLVCGRMGCGRVGNMVVLKQKTVILRSDNGEKVGERPRLQMVVGPYWPVSFFITFPGICLFSLFVCHRHSLWESTWKFSIWAVINFALFFSLCMTCCSDPGIQYRYSELPSTEDPNITNWRWSDQALTFRPAHARFDPETAVVVEEFDHTCPWTGTAIGKNNIKYFRIFVPLVFITIAVNSVMVLWI